MSRFDFEAYRGDGTEQLQQEPAPDNLHNSNCADETQLSPRVVAPDILANQDYPCRSGLSTGLTCRLGQTGCMWTERYHPNEIDELPEIARKELVLSCGKEMLIEALQRHSTTDSLTGLGNHRALYENWKKLYTETHPVTNYIGVLVLDVDNFKRVNDDRNVGHTGGDELLRTFAQYFESVMFIDDEGHRPGGDEFVILFKNRRLEEMEEIKARMIKDIHNPATPEFKRFLENYPTVKIGASIGITCVDTSYGTDLDTALDEADKDLYREKHRRKSRGFRGSDRNPAAIEQ